MTSWPTIILGLTVVNIWTMLLFWYDKRCAQNGARRVREDNLLGLALIGGSPGALLGRQMFLHKTRKQPFSTYLMLIVMVQAGVIGGLAYAFF